jgi:hypothetical protein
VSLYRLRRIEAVQWSGSNWHEVYAMAEKNVWVVAENMLMASTGTFEFRDGKTNQPVIVSLQPGMWLIKHTLADGTMYDAMTDDRFRSTYEEIEP